MTNSVITGIVATFDRDNIDTDQIIPTEYLKSIKKFGFGDFLFDGWRYLDEGRLDMTAEDRSKNHDFILNKEPFTNAEILLARDNFGCGSSREHAVWALRDFGFKAVIASSFGDIFYNNCFKNSVLPIKLSKEEINHLFEISKSPSVNFQIDLQRKNLQFGHDSSYSFDVKDSLLDRIINNLDDVDITLKHKSDIEIFEQTRRNQRPWLFDYTN
ncbi:3-isopropylmalate dehydratase small subunit [Pseudomonadota bacterium]|jgi:3-isopropylmalate/(R)-2-methylmalate dehydratase small subunit|nr:3-isopropylmalate dehydratase small subunit [Pseudomonadota bacterium]|tara:strand:- start:1467 stop:2108 length:642 start_codon:yes stop_codon:yes gene_type:complete